MISSGWSKIQLPNPNSQTTPGPANNEITVFSSSSVNRLADKPDAPAVLKSPFQMLLSSDYIQAANDSRRADLMTEAVGQGVAFVNEPLPVKDILHGMVAEAQSVLGDLT